MTKQTMMTEAHKMAKTFEGNYSACLALALRTLNKKEEQTMKGTKEEIEIANKAVAKHLPLIETTLRTNQERLQERLSNGGSTRVALKQIEKSEKKIELLKSNDAKSIIAYFVTEL